ncbi:MAG: enoyl-CoA hydratase/isomerase family protein [Burkholderiales bacterium]|nr:enoyl-CoA hydratase/isomerase family protein [Burkholderiales bacterium]
MSALLFDKYPEGLAVLSMNRPQTHNAFDDELVADMTTALQEFDADPSVRIVILSAHGPSFSAGADLHWMERMANCAADENRRDAMRLATLMSTLNGLSKPTIARVHGPAYGGGVGLVACCDIAVASHDATFALSEVKLGLIPAVISPYVIAAIGERMARRYFLTGERFDAVEAYRIGLVQEITVDEASLDEVINRLVSVLLAASPAAQVEAKKLIAAVAGRPVDEAMVRDTAERIARVRGSAEASEGMSAFLAKRNPAWTKT